MISRRQSIALIFAAVCRGSVVAAQDKTATVTLVIEGMT